MTTANYPPPPRQTANPAPLRRPQSVRRTSSIDVSWPDGPRQDRLLQGRARDYVTSSDGSGSVLAEGTFDVRMTEDKTISAISAQPAPPGLDQLVGQRAGGHLRLALRELMPELLAKAAPLYLPLDDLSGTALVSAFAWSQWDDDWVQSMRSRMAEGELERMMASRINICWGLAEGNSGVTVDKSPGDVADADAGDLVNTADPQGWHALPGDAAGPSFRRARRIDVSRDDQAGLIHIDAAFQDSAARKHGGRVAIHEYRIIASAEIATGTLLSLEPEARILPFAECPGAIANARKLVGSTVQDIRETVLDNLRGTHGCTHLNDALRALAEVPKLAQVLAG